MLPLARRSRLSGVFSSMLATLELIREAAQHRRLSEAVPRWLSNVPLYRGAAASARLDAIGSLPADFLPPLPDITKHDLRRDFPRNFLPAGVELETLLDDELVELEHTSGTSEERTALLLPRGWWAEQEDRALRHNPWVASVLDASPEARRVTLISPVCNNDLCYRGWPSRADRVLGNALFVNVSRHPFLWSEADLERMAAEALEWQPQFLDVDPVYGALFARYCERRGLRLPSLRFILSSYEYASVTHRQILRRAFGVPVFSLYGSTETGHLLMEDEAGEMVPSLETAFLEVLNPDAGGVGELVVTTLTNDYMPLIRYRIGDLLERHEHPYRTRYVVHGRAVDAFSTSTGGRVTTRQIDECFAGLTGIVHYQLRQRGGDDWVLRFVPEADGPSAAAQAELRQRLASRLELPSGPAFEATDSLLAEGSGKFRLGYPAATAGMNG